MTWRIAREPSRNPALRLAKPTGKPLEPTTRRVMEARFGHDFSAARVHADPAAARAAHRLDAAAYTAGENVVFGAGRYAPATPPGHALLAHELAHVVQQRAGVAVPQAVSQPGNADEIAASRAMSEIGAGRKPGLAAAHAGIQRQPATAPAASPNLLPRASILPAQSQAELAVESFLNRMWDAQSGQKQPFRVSDKVKEGLGLIDPMLLLALGPVTEMDSPNPLLDRLRGRLPVSLDTLVEKALDRLPDRERKLTSRPRPEDADSAKPQFPQREPRPGEPPPAPKGASEVAAKALQAALEEFQKTKLGKELAQAAKAYVFSKEGIPLVLLVVGGVATFLAANDPSLPATPDIPIGKGIKLKLELSRASDLPPLLRDIAHGEAEPGHQPERKAAATVTFTNDALVDAAAAIGHFFAEAAVWIARGAVKAGTVIARAASRALPTIEAMVGGAALGAGIGAAVGHAGLGAGIGAAAGAGLGLLLGLVGPVISRKLEERRAKKEAAA